MLSVVTPILTDDLANLATIGARVSHSQAEWVVVADAGLADLVCETLGLVQRPALAMSDAPRVAPESWDLASTDGPVRVVASNAAGGGTAALVGVGLGAARGEWLWVVEPEDIPCEGSVQHLCEVMVELEPQFIVGSMVTVGGGVQYPSARPLRPGPAEAGAVRQLWSSPDAMLPFPLPAVVFRTDDLRATGGWQSVMQGLACLMRQDKLGGGYFTDVNLLYYTVTDSRRQRFADNRRIEAVLRRSCLAAGDYQGLGDAPVPAWYLREADPAPNRWPPGTTQAAPWRLVMQRDLVTAHAGYPTLSIITPTRLRSERMEYFAELAESIFALPLPAGRVEWLVQEDGSSPQGHELIPDAIWRNPSFRYEANGTQAGAATSRNMALARARGVVVLAADDDDIIDADGVMAALSAFDHDGCGFVIGALATLGREGVRSGPFGPLGLSGEVDRHALARRWAHPTNVFPAVHTASLVRRDVVLAAGGWQSLPLGEDLGMLLAASALSRGFAVPDTVALYRKHAGQITNDLSSSAVEMQCRLALWKRAVALSGPSPLRCEQREAWLELTQMDRLTGVRTSRWFHNGSG